MSHTKVCGGNNCQGCEGVSRDPLSFQNETDSKEKGGSREFQTALGRGKNLLPLPGLGRQKTSMNAVKYPIYDQ